MIRAEFHKKNGSLCGFDISGHSGYAESGSDIVCAAVSSAVQLTVNLLDAFGCEPEVSAEENIIRCIVRTAEYAQFQLLNQLKAHIQSVSEEFPETIRITISEV
ncbi:MAG: ribosomal-processing cysteine protease Prp [Ruminococcus sp.]|nr:ribosomal-processing cysteine protease Prp [Ruminococcus sp.]MDE6785384.1 ribosomal-processing cysteine protease Prp [Ruminococcus sp.]